MGSYPTTAGGSTIKDEAAVSLHDWSSGLCCHGGSGQAPVLGALLGNAVGATFNTAFGRDCKGRPQGDYFFGCQCVGPFNIGRRKRSPVDTRFFINSNQGIGGDFARCSLGTLLNRNG